MGICDVDLPSARVAGTLSRTSRCPCPPRERVSSTETETRGQGSGTGRPRISAAGSARRAHRRPSADRRPIAAAAQRNQSLSVERSRRSYGSRATSRARAKHLWPSGPCPRVHVASTTRGSAARGRYPTAAWSARCYCPARAATRWRTWRSRRGSSPAVRNPSQDALDGGGVLPTGAEGAISARRAPYGMTAAVERGRERQ